jgi:hypothetical protein
MYVCACGLGPVTTAATQAREICHGVFLVDLMALCANGFLVLPTHHVANLELFPFVPSSRIRVLSKYGTCVDSFSQAWTGRQVHG